MDNLKTILTRGVEQVLPTKEALLERLSQGPIKLYLGIDPTGPLHLGHLSVLLKIRDFQQAGHETVILLGDFTATIGDPSDKTSTRKVLTPEEVENNLKDYKEQIVKVLDKDKTIFRRNSEWLSKMTTFELITLTTKVTIQQTLKRDMFRRRQEEGKDIHMNEFLYPILQGYDSVVLGVDLEVGGNDQLFNMLAGRDLAKKISGKDKFVLTGKLLVDPIGKKMGKTDGNFVGMSDSPHDILGKIMSWPDTLMPLGFEILTRIPEEEYQNILKGHPKEAKLTLAEEVVKLIYGADEAKKARQEFGLTPENIETVTVEEGTKLVEALLTAGLIESKSEFRRLVEQGGVNLNDNKITDPDALVAEGRVKVGPLRFLNITLE